MLNAPTRSTLRQSRRKAYGLSIVELMVGVAVGLLLVGGAMSMYMAQLSGSRTLTREIRVNQDLRAAADVIARDLRRSGYWGNAISGVLNTATNPVTAANPYATVSGSYGAASSQIAYNFSRDATENNALDTNEQFGFRLSGGAIEMRTDSATWQAITDVDVVTVTRFEITDTQTQIAVGDMCTSGCNTTPPTPPSAPTSACPNPPALTLHRFDILIEGNAAADAKLKRTLRESVRIRNNQYSGQCP